MFDSDNLKNNEDFKEIDTNNLIVLCELGEDYKLFCNDLEELIKSKRNSNLAVKVFQAMQGIRTIHSKKYKEFIEKHKHAIEIMQNYS